MIYSKVAILGLGLLGGAIAKDIKAKKMAKEVCVWGRNLPKVKRACLLGMGDNATDDLAQAVENAQVIILATPPDIIIRHLSDILLYLKKDMLIMDVGSVKRRIVNAAKDLDIDSSGAHFIPCHPMAGSEKTGAENAYEGMFIDAPCILTPYENNSTALARAKEFWESLGSRVIVMDADQHDKNIAFLSHMPHLVSAALMNTVANNINSSDEIKELSGPSIKDMTRIALADAELWMQIYNNNREYVLESLGFYIRELTDMKEKLAASDEINLKSRLSLSAKHRKNIFESE